MPVFIPDLSRVERMPVAPTDAAGHYIQVVPPGCVNPLFRGPDLFVTSQFPIRRLDSLAAARFPFSHRDSLLRLRLPFPVPGSPSALPVPPRPAPRPAP
jgi:hypothetical protein